MTRNSIITLSLALATVVQSQAMETSQDSLYSDVSASTIHMLEPLQPSFLSHTTLAAGWDSNWFVQVCGGASAFIGSPIGCADLFDRTMPVFQVGIGKWFTPAVGGRIAYQGLKFKDSNLQTNGYKFVHADFLYNLTHNLDVNEAGLSSWDVIPFVGVGMIHNTDYRALCECRGFTGDTHPFAFSYGIMGRYRITNRLHLVAELSGMTTFKSFDAIGASNRFGDNMLNLSAGLSLTLGKSGWKRVVDARPYVVQNEYLLKHIGSLEEANARLSRKVQDDERIKAEFQKILEMEGLLDIYGDLLKDGNKVKPLYPKNDYSGLNSLRARLGSKGWDGNPSQKHLGVAGPDSLNIKSMEKYLLAMQQGKECIGAPIYFFFHIRTSDFTEPSQLLNIDEIARIAKTYGLKINVSGAADSATGTERINDTLSRQRAEYIKHLFTERGVSASRIHTTYEGGIDEFSPIQVNRNTCVTLSF